MTAAGGSAARWGEEQRRAARKGVWRRLLAALGLSPAARRADARAADCVAEGEMMLWLLMSRDRLVAETAAAGHTWKLVVEEIPPLVPFYGATLPAGADPVSMADIDSRLPPVVVAALASAWLLMEQPLLIDRTRERADKSTARAYARDSLSTPEVTVVDLRRQYTPADQEENEGMPGRHYRHRWVVSGHWRNQAYGPDRSLRRKTWVPSYVKGPDGAPLLSTERVNVWRR